MNKSKLAQSQIGLLVKRRFRKRFKTAHLPHNSPQIKQIISETMAYQNYSVLG